jgi:hypothetical protein
VASRGGQPTLFGQEALDVALCALRGLDAGQGLGASVGTSHHPASRSRCGHTDGRRLVFDQTVGPRVPPSAQQLGDLPGPRAVRPTAWLSIVGRVDCGHDPLQGTAPAPHAAGRGCSTPQPSPDRPARRCAALTLAVPGAPSPTASCLAGQSVRRLNAQTASPSARSPADPTPASGSTSPS